MELVKTNNYQVASVIGHLLLVVALNFEWSLLPIEHVSHNWTSPQIARGIKFDKRCRHTYRSIWSVQELPRIKSCILDTIGDHCAHLQAISCGDWIQEVWKRTHHYAQNQGDIMKEGTISPPPPFPQQKRHLCPANSIRKMWSQSIYFINSV